MTTFEPRAMERDRGQLLYRYRPSQTFDHPGGFTAQVRQYGADDAFQGPPVDPGYLIGEARRLVRRWRAEGRNAPGAEVGSDRAPEFPGEVPLAEQQYEVVIPGKVFCRVWPRTVRCQRSGCGRVWRADDPVPGQESPGNCPSCRDTNGRQLQYVFVHDCGVVVAMEPPFRGCDRCHHNEFRLDDRASRFLDFRWECMNCRATHDVQEICPNRGGCAWTNKRMAPQVHTASSAYAGQGLTLVNVPLEEHTRRMQTMEFVLGSIGHWLGECTVEEAAQLAAAGNGGPPEEVVQAIAALEAAGMTDQAQGLRQRFVPLEVDDLRARITTRLGFDPLEDVVRGPQLAANIDVYERVLQLPQLTLPDLERAATSAGRAALYADYSPTLQRCGFDPGGVFLVKEFPVTYLAVGYCRGGFTPAEADLVAYKGRAGRGQAVKTLIYAHPTVTEALVFTLDRDRVARWLIANGAATAEDLSDGVARWLAAHMTDYDGRLPPPWNHDPEQEDRSDAEYGPRLLFRLLHSASHQMLRGLAVDSGYSETALSEYLFPYALAFAIHPNGGSEFTIGGLRTVLEQNMAEVVSRAVDNDTCIYDPNCMVANRGADHGCLQLPETACQSWNWFISRWELFGSPDGEVVGYWSPELDLNRT